MKVITVVIIGLIICGCSLNREQEKIFIELINIQYNQNYAEYTFQIQNDSNTIIPTKKLIFFYNFQIFDNNNIEPSEIYKSEAIYSTDINIIDKGKNKIIVKDKNLERFKLEKDSVYRIEFSIKYENKIYYFKKKLMIITKLSSCPQDTR